MSKKRLAVFVSGSGTNLQAIIDAEIPNIDIVLVFSNKSDSYALERAKKHSIPTEVLDHKGFSSREDYENKIIELIDPYNVDLIALAGFMRILSPVFVRKFKNRIINIHPALLPAFPGTHAAKQALDYGVKYTGCTVHFVDEGVDTGPIILQSVVEIKDDDDEDSLLERLHVEEHKIYTDALRLISEDSVGIVGKRVVKKTS